MVRALSWHALRVAPRELRLDLTLSNGQCFGWQRSPSDESTWIGVVGPRVIALRQTEQDCLFRCLGTARTAAPVRADDAKVRVRAELSDVFQLDRLIEPLREEWSASDPRMQSVCTALPGMRILRQDPVECLFSFICSSNNNIGRITGMLQAIRRAYGEHIPLSDPNALDDHSLPDIPLSDPTAAADPSLPRIPLTNPSAGDAISMPGDDDDLSLPHTDYFAFPTIAALAAASETDLRALGLGYRAPYLLKTAEALMQRGDAWLGSLRASRDPAYVRSELCGLMGVGPKVADCVALFSLDQTDAVPVDTHVWTIACREYDASLRLCASLTPEVYRRVGQLFRSRYVWS
jgi:N-glycosylase/DNA lyase